MQLNFFKAYDKMPLENFFTVFLLIMSRYRSVTIRLPSRYRFWLDVTHRYRFSPTFFIIYDRPRF